MIRFIMTVAIIATFAAPAEARRHYNNNPLAPSQVPTPSVDHRYEYYGPTQVVGKPRQDRVKSESRTRGANKAKYAISGRSGGRDGCRSGVGSLSCVIGPLGTKAREIVDACGSRVVSAIAGRANKSNHPIGRAVDLVGNPGCIYSHLHGWPGGYSTDYGRVHHVHISYNPGGQEWGVRFAHGGHRHRTATQYADITAINDKHRSK